MKMGNIVPRAGIEPTSLAFRASVLTISPRSLSNMSHIPVPTCLCSSLPERGQCRLLHKQENKKTSLLGLLKKASSFGVSEIRAQFACMSRWWRHLPTFSTVLSQCLKQIRNSASPQFCHHSMKHSAKHPIKHSAECFTKHIGKRSMKHIAIHSTLKSTLKSTM